MLKSNRQAHRKICKNGKRGKIESRLRILIWQIRCEGRKRTAPYLFSKINLRRSSSREAFLQGWALKISPSFWTLRLEETSIWFWIIAQIYLALIQQQQQLYHHNLKSNKKKEEANHHFNKNSNSSIKCLWLETLKLYLHSRITLITIQLKL